MRSRLTGVLGLALLLLLRSHAAAITFTYFQVPGGGNMWGITSGPDGKIWFTDLSNDTFGSLDPLAGNDAAILASIATYPSGIDPTRDIQFIERGPGGTLCFNTFGSIAASGTSTVQIGCFLPATPGTVTIHPVSRPDPDEAGFWVESLAAGPDGNLWFVSMSIGVPDFDFIGQMQLASNTVTAFNTVGAPVTLQTQSGHDVVTGPDGNLWFTSGSVQQPGSVPVPIGRLLPGAPNTFTYFPIPIEEYLARDLAVGPDNRVWYTTRQGLLGSLDPLAGTDGAILASHQGFTAYVGELSELAGIVAGPDGNVWFTNQAGYVGHLDPAAGTEADIQDSMRMYAQGVFAGAQVPGPIAAGADGNLWFVDRNQVVWRISNLADDSNALPVPPPPPVCPPAPTAGCRTDVTDEGHLKIMDSNNDNNDKIIWSWKGATVTTKAEFADPVLTDTYELCVYDGASNLIAKATAPVAGQCNGSPCWTETANGYVYNDAAATPDGIKRIVLRQGLTAGDARIRLRAKGFNVDTPSTFPILQPVVAQLLQNSGPCFESTYSAPALENEDGPPGPPGEFRDRND
jgi:streptogramin lyase